MTKILRCRAAITTYALLLVVASLSQPASALETQGLAAEVQDGMQRWHVPGMAVAVVDSNQTWFQEGFGTTATDGAVAVDEHTLFAIASTTKAMVVAGMLMLADDGLLTIDDLVIKYIPELHFGNPALTQQVTIRDLLAHRTGLPSTDAWVFLQNVPLDEQIRRLQHVSPIAGIRERLIYQNTMYELAGLIIERVSGKRWDRFLTERLWHPIGMRETYGARGQIPAEKTHVLPHYYVDNQLQQAQWDIDEEHADAAGSVWSSVHDMSLWAQFLLRGAITADGQQLLTDVALADMFEPQQLIAPDDFYPTIELTKPHWRTYGLGWFQQDFQGRRIDFHTGSLSGLIAIIGLDRAANKAVIALGNRDHAEMRHAVLWSVMDNLSLADKRDWSQDIFDLYQAAADDAKEEREAQDNERVEESAPALPLADYAGSYQNDVFGEVTIEHDNSSLTVLTSRHSFDLSHWNYDVFLLSKPEWEFRDFVNFEIGSTGTVTGMVLLGEKFMLVAEQ